MKIKESEAGRLALKLDTDSTGDLKILVLQNYILFCFPEFLLLIILRKYNRQKDKISILCFIAIELNDTYPLVTKGAETTFHFILGLPLLIQVVDQLHIYISQIQQNR
jgi:hypothetical protein